MTLRENYLIRIFEKYLIGLLSFYIIGWFLFVIFFFVLYFVSFTYNTLDFIVYYITGSKALRPQLETRNIKIHSYDVFVFAIIITMSLWYYKIEKPHDEERLYDIANQKRVDSLDKLGDTYYTEGNTIQPENNINTTPVQNLTADDYFRIGNESTLSKNYPAAITYYSKAIELDTSNGEYYSNRAIAEHQMADNRSAYLDWKKAVDLGNQYAVYAINEFCKQYTRLKTDTPLNQETNPNNPKPDSIVSNNNISTAPIQYTVIVSRAYFYDTPGDLQTIRKGYLVNGESLIGSKEVNGFVYCEFTNPTSMKISKGWISKDCIK